MSQEHASSGYAFVSRVGKPLFGGPSPIEKAFRTCENTACRQRRIYWPAWLRKDEGICLQGLWYCSPECFEHAARTTLMRLLPAKEEEPRRQHRIPIGLLLLSRGTISDGQLKQALLLQREQGGGRIGKILREIH